MVGKVLENAIDRAINIACAEPKGPIYLTLPREVLAESADRRWRAISRPAGIATRPRLPFPDLRAIDEAAEMIARAENPLIITSSAGRDEGDVAKLAALAEAFAIPVSQRKPRYVALPTDHPMHLGFDPDSMLQAADLIIVADCVVPWIPGKRAPRPDAKIIHLGVDPLFTAYPMRGFASDLAITGLLSETLSALTQALATRYGAAASRVEARRERLVGERAAQRKAWAEQLAQGPLRRPTRCRRCGFPTASIRSRTTTTLSSANRPLVLEQMRFNKPGTMFYSGAGGGLGWSLGASLGSRPPRPTVG